MREEYLLYHLRSGNLAAGDELKAEHERPLRRYLGHIIGDAEAARLAESVMARGLAAARWSETEQSFRNILLLVSEDAVREHISDRCAQRGLELRARSRQRDRLWREALAILPLELQVVVELCVKHVLPIKAVAAVLGQPTRAIHRKLAQANHLLARIQDDLRARAYAAVARRTRELAESRAIAVEPRAARHEALRLPRVPPLTGSAVLNQIQFEGSL